MLPHFLIIGAGKSGTTSLYHYLIQHPFIFGPRPKEINYFNINYHKGISWYESYFNPNQYLIPQELQAYFVTGEATPDYLFNPHAPQRVKNDLPQVKLIILLRNPIDRAYSHYFMRVKLNQETLGFEEAIEAEIEQEQAILKGELEKLLVDKNYYSLNCSIYLYLARGIYINQVKNWLNLFPPEQFLIIKSEDFFANPTEIYKQVLAFLGLPNYELKMYKRYNQNQYPLLIKPEIRERLSSYFAPYNEELYKYLKTNFNWD
jgi:hypothetical protein